MSPDELAEMQRTGEVQYGSGGTSYVANPASSSSFTAAPPGSVYVEYDVPSDSLYPAGRSDWSQILSPDSPTGMRYAKLGNPPSGNIPATNIRMATGS
jgi:hypothetical protein